MKGVDLFNIAVLISPVCSALLMLVMLGWDILKPGKDKKQPHQWLFLFFISTTIRGLSPILYYYTPGVFVYYNWLYYLTLFLTPVLYYRFLFEITRIRAGERFPWQHYVFPLATSLPVLVLTVALPYDELYRVIISHYNYPFIDGFLGIISYINLPAKFAVVLLYFILCMIRFGRYRKYVADHSSVNERAFRWVYRYPLFILVVNLILLVILLAPYSVHYLSPLVIIQVLILAFLQLNIVYHTLRQDYIIVELPDVAPPEDTPLETADPCIPQSQKKELLTKEFFEEYIHTRKPYLNPNLKIADLVDELEMNRTYISGFINREYNMNFSRYITHCRLNEYNRLLKDPSMNDKSKDELAELAGFASYRYFLRLKGKKM